LLKKKENIGFVKANNIAIKEAKGRYILFLNPDTELISDAITSMMRFLEKRISYGAVGCKLIYPNGCIQYVCARTFPTPINQFCLLSAMNRFFPKSEALSTVEMRYWDHNDSREVDCLSGACMLVRKEIINKLSGFDENIFMYAEDVDLCFRLKKLGWKIFYLAECKIIHYSGASSSQQKNKYFGAIMQRESNLYFIRKHFGKKKAKRYVTAVLFGSIIRMMLITLIYPFMIMNNNFIDNASPQVIIKYLKLFVWSFKKLYPFRGSGGDFRSSITS